MTSEQEFLIKVASEGIGYAIMNYSLEDSEMADKVAEAKDLLYQIWTWAENHPDFEEM